MHVSKLFKSNIRCLGVTVLLEMMKYFNLFDCEYSVRHVDLKYKVRFVLISCKMNKTCHISLLSSISAPKHEIF